MRDFLTIHFCCIKVTHEAFQRLGIAAEKAPTDISATINSNLGWKLGEAVTGYRHGTNPRSQF